MTSSLLLGMPGPFEWIIIAGLGLLIFGRRLPEVGRSLGLGIIEFKKGLKGIDNDVDTDDTANRQQIAGPAQSGDASTK